MSDLSIDIVIIGKNEIIREGLKRILIEQKFNVQRAVSQVSDLDQGVADNTVVIVDVSDIDDGLSVCGEVRERYPNTRIVIMADEYSMEDVSRAFMTGAVDGYLVKEIACRPLASALRMTFMGEKVLPSQIAYSLASSTPCSMSRYWDFGTSGSNLSTREVDILRCLVDGEPNKIISRRLHIADATVKVHIKAILRKLHVRNRTQAAIWAVNRGLANDVPAPAPVQTELGMQVARAS